MYLDSAYVAKYYVNEPDATAVRKLIMRAESICSSSWALLEVTSVFRRHMREGSLTLAQGRQLMAVFETHVQRGLWHLIPVSEALLRRTVKLVRGLPPNVPLRAGDAIHLATALDQGEPEIWTNDRHLLAAASHFGISGKSV
ncbi:MAG TPA: type II toxin-antitoxin system VapC family toxin [Bryobacteraceae bacterium]|nr:type II toxin-antitoxin system VapC family toxin [Bryobacteraceae bacterium]